MVSREVLLCYGFVTKLKLIDEVGILKENKDNAEFMEIYNSLKLKNHGERES
jgi:hypothetical protein